MEVVARRGDDYLVILFEQNHRNILTPDQQRAVVLETYPNEVTASLPLDNILGRGYWEAATMPQEELYQRLAGATHVPDRDGRSRALELLPVAIK
jgi:hypothetical protein